MPMIFFVTKQRMRAIVKAAYFIHIIKKVNLHLSSITTLLPLIKEDIKPVDRLEGKLMARKAIFEQFLSKQIEYIVNQHGYTMAYPVINIHKADLEAGYINLSTEDGEDNVGDVILYLTNGDVKIINETGTGRKPVRENALIYHEIIKD